MSSRGKKSSRTPKFPKRSIQEIIPQSASVAINRLPVEILVGIISLATSAGDVSPKSRYPCIPFSRVCRYWRSAVLGNALFWNVIVFDESMSRTRGSRDVLQELLKRSQTAPLHIIVHEKMISIRAFWDGLHTDASRVKTLHLNNCLAAHPHSFPDLIAFFPSIESLFYPDYPARKSKNLSSGVHLEKTNLKALQISAEKSLRCFAIPPCFPELRWLDLGYESSVSMPSLLTNLSNFPNLQFLRLFPCSIFSDMGRTKLTTPFSNPTIITFPELKVFRAILGGSSNLNLISAPNLTYLEVEVDNYSAKHYAGQFCGFDFSRITRIRLQVYDWDKVCITGCNDSEANSSSYHGTSQLAHPILTSYPNQFQFQVQYFDSENPHDSRPSIRALFHPISAYIKKTTNVIELVLGSISFKSPQRLISSGELEFFLTAVKEEVTAIREFTVTCGPSFATLCDFLSNGTLFPCLEKLTYLYTWGEKFQGLTDSRSLQKLMEERSITGSKHLEIVLLDFPPITSDLLKQSEKLGIRLTQKST